MEWSYPWALLGLLALPVLAFLSLRARRFAVGREWWVAFALRSAGVTLLLAALAQPSWNVPDARTDWLLLVDGSRSMAAESGEWIRAYVKRAEPRLEAGDRRAVVEFAGDAVLMQGWDGPGGAGAGRQLLEPGHTDLEAGLRAALAEIDGGRRSRILLFSDGRETRGDALAAAETARKQGVPVFAVIPEPARQPSEAWVEQLILPPRVRVGEAFQLEVVLGATVRLEASLTVRQGRNALRRKVRLGGRTVVPVVLVAGQAGLQPVEVSIAATPDQHRDNNSIQRMVLVEAGPAVLLVGGSAEHSRPLEQALSLQGFQVRLTGPEGLPRDAAGLEPFDVVVFDNVPAAGFTAAQLAELGSYVSDRGGGFVMLGNDQSFGSGGYYQTALEPVLPVNLAVPTPRELPYVALVTVIDQSESMASGVAIRSMLGSKLEVAKLASISAIELLNPTDMGGVVSFNNAAGRPVPLALKASLGPLDAQLEPLLAEGGTDLYLGLEAAIEDLRGIDAMKKHIIALSDGVTRFRRFDTLVKAAAAEGITLSTVYLGYWGDRLLLKRLSEWGQGRHYQTMDPKRIPRIFVKDAELATRSVLSEREFQPAPLLPGHEILQGLPDGPLPRLKGHVITTAKPGSEVVIAAEHDSPLLAVHRYGLGRAVAFTSDLSTAWGAEWVRWPAYSRFAAQLVRWAQRRTAQGGLHASASAFLGEGRLTVDAVDPAGRYRNGVPLRLEVAAPDGAISTPPVEQVAPGRYQARFAAAQPGAYALTLREAGGGANGMVQRLTLGMPYSAELVAPGADAPRLAVIAEATGGALLPGNDPAGDVARMQQGGAARSTRYPLWPYLVAALVGLFVIDIAYRQLKRGAA